MADKQTSDERLLKLIEGSADPKRRQSVAQSPKKLSSALNPVKINFGSLIALKGFKIKLFDFNRGLMGLAVLLTLIFIFSFLSAPVISKSTAAFFSAADAASVGKVISGIQAQGLMRKSILGQEIRKNIFFPSGVDLVSSGAEVDLTELTKDLKLVGIVWSANPEIMIESAKDLRTYLLKNGDFFNGDIIKVKEVKRNSAILEIKTESGPKEYEIR